MKRFLATALPAWALAACATPDALNAPAPEVCAVELVVLGVGQDAGIPQISPSSTNPKYTQQGFKTTFRVVAHDDQQGPTLARFAAKTLQAALDSNKMTIIVCKCQSGNIKVPVITMDPVTIRDRFMGELKARNA